MMITTLTLNPAIDKTLILEDFVVNGINRVKSINIEPGGKGINASKIIKSLGGETIALGILGGVTGDVILSMLKEKGIPQDFIRIRGETRTNTKIVDIKNNTCTEVNESGPIVQKDELDKLVERIVLYSKKSDILILSGNAQSSVPKTIYKDIIEHIKKNTKTILDSSGKLLREGIKAIPWMIKPNIKELRELTNKELSNVEELVLECKALIKTGISYVCLSLGKDGLLLMSKDEAYLAIPPEVMAKSTVGAGDSVVGSLALSFSQNEDLACAARKACAVGTASVTLEGTGVPTKEIIDEFYNAVEIKRDDYFNEINMKLNKILIV